MEFIKTFYGYMTEKEVEWLNKKLIATGWPKVHELKGTPCAKAIDKNGNRYWQPIQCFKQFMDMKKAQNAIWRDICSETSNITERLDLFSQRWNGVI